MKGIFLAKVYFTKYNGFYSLKLNNLCLPKDTFQTLTNIYYIINNNFGI